MAWMFSPQLKSLIPINIMQNKTNTNWHPFVSNDYYVEQSGMQYPWHIFMNHLLFDGSCWYVNTIHTTFWNVMIIAISLGFVLTKFLFCHFISLFYFCNPQKCVVVWMCLNGCLSRGRCGTKIMTMMMTFAMTKPTSIKQGFIAPANHAYPQI